MNETFPMGWGFTQWERLAAVDSSTLSVPVRGRVRIRSSEHAGPVVERASSIGHGGTPINTSAAVELRERSGPLCERPGWRLTGVANAG
ncbi:MAG: hypothetical protein ABI742_03810, partial [Gemmatimonadota bacterium]